MGVPCYFLRSFKVCFCYHVIKLVFMVNFSARLDHHPTIKSHKEGSNYLTRTPHFARSPQPVAHSRQSVTRSPHTLSLQSVARIPAARNLWPAARNLWPAARIPATRNLWPATRTPQSVARNPQPATRTLVSLELLTTPVACSWGPSPSTRYTVRPLFKSLHNAVKHVNLPTVV